MAEDLFGCRRRIILSIFFYLNLCLQINRISAQNLLNYTCINTIGNYSEESLFHTNLNSIFPLSAANVKPYRFYSRTLGIGVDQVNAVAYCWGDGLFDSCAECINVAANNISKVCPNQKEAIGWYEKCMFRYSNKNIYGNMSLTPFNNRINSTRATHAHVFSQNLNLLADRLLEQASNLMYYGTSYIYTLQQITNPDGVAIDGVMLCTPDISSGDCMSCLNHTKEELLRCCDKVVGARYATPNCVFWFETRIFYDLPYSETEELNKLKKRVMKKERSETKKGKREKAEGEERLILQINAYLSIQKDGGGRLREMAVSGGDGWLWWIAWPNWLNVVIKSGCGGGEKIED